MVIGETAIVKDDLALDHGDHAIIGGGAKGFGEHRPAQEPSYRSPARRGSEICLTRPLLLLAFPAAVFFRLAGGSCLIPNWTMIPSLSSSGIASFTFCPKLGPEHLGNHVPIHYRPCVALISCVRVVGLVMCPATQSLLRSEES